MARPAFHSIQLRNWELRMKSSSQSNWELLEGQPIQGQCHDQRLHQGSWSNQAAARVYLGPVGQAQYWRAHKWNPACSDSVMCTLLELIHGHWRKRNYTPAVNPTSGANPEMQGHCHLTTYLPLPKLPQYHFPLSLGQWHAQSKAYIISLDALLSFSLGGIRHDPSSPSSLFPENFYGNHRDESKKNSRILDTSK